MTSSLTDQQRSVFNYLSNAPRVNPDADDRNLTIWWFGSGPYIPELRTGASFLFSKPPAELTPFTIDALAAAGMLAVSKRANVWYVILAPETPGDGADWQEQFRPRFEQADEPPPTPLMPNNQTTRVRLAQLIDETFDAEELRNLCFDLGIDADNLLGERKETKARDLVSRMDKYGRLAELEQVLAGLRPSHYQRLFGSATG